MLVIRMQRVGRSGHAQFRVVVQDSRQSPKSGKTVALLGSYNPHTKTTQFDKVKTEHFIKNGAQPSERVAKLLKNEGVKLPDWVKVDSKKSGTLRHADKLRKNRPAGTEEPEPKEETKPATENEAAEKLSPDTDTQGEETVAATTESDEKSAETEENTPADEAPIAEPESADETQKQSPELESSEPESTEPAEEPNIPSPEAEKSKSNSPEPEPKTKA